MRTFLICIAAASFLRPELIALSEGEYRAKYAFAVDQAPPSTETHPSGDFRVVTKFSIRECDADNGELVILEFHKGKKIIRSYTLNDLFPDPETWNFHRATGVFLWIMFNPAVNGFHSNTYSVLTVTGIQSFEIATGEPVETTQAQVQE